MHENNRCLSDDNNTIVHSRNGYANDEVLQPLFKSADPSANNNNESSPAQIDVNQLQNGKDGSSPENLPNENCSTICNIVPISSLDAAGHHQQLSSSTSVLTTASSSNLEDMNAVATFEAQQRHHWMTAHPSSAFTYQSYNPLLFTPPTDWLSSYNHQQNTSLLQNPQLQQQQMNDSLMNASQMNSCTVNNQHFVAPFYGLAAADSTHNPMLFIQPQNIQSVIINYKLIIFNSNNFRT